MKSIAIYILAITFLSALLLGLSYQVKLPDGIYEMQVYSQTTPLVGECGQIDEMTNFNIYHYYDKVVSIKDCRLDNTYNKKEERIICTLRLPIQGNEEQIMKLRSRKRYGI